MGRAYAFVEGQWLPCTADALLQVQGRSEREWELILDEMRSQQRQHGKKRVTVNGPLLAQFLEEMATEEQLLLQQQRDHEGQSIREAIVGEIQVTGLLAFPQEQDEVDEELDLTTLPKLEEYR
jgi:putative transposase